MRRARSWRSVVAGLALAVVGLAPAAGPTLAVEVSEFTDVPVSHPFYLEISWLASAGVTTGYADGSFHPAEAVSRQAVAAFLYRYAGSPSYTAPVVSPFTDVPTTHSFYTEISWLADQAITTGYADGSFHPEETVSRQAVAAFLYRFANRPAFTAPVTPSFSDVPTSAGFYTEIEWLASTGITTGYADSTFHPTEDVSRQAIAAFLYRYDTNPDLGGFSTTRVSTASDGTQGASESYNPSVSADGRWIVYESDASTLVAGDTNGTSDVFVTDRTTGVTSRVSAATDGTQGDGSSSQPSISGDGRWIAYQSDASNLVAGDTNGMFDVFVTDRTTGATTLVSAATDATQGDHDSWNPSISGDGRWIAYVSGASNLVAGDANGTYDVFVTDRTTGDTTLVSAATDGTQGDHDSWNPAISADGRWIAYETSASTLVVGDENTMFDVFVTDRTTGATTLVSAATDGTQGDFDSWNPSISADGRWIAYESSASTLVVGDTNDANDVFVTDQTTGVTTLVSAATDGTQAQGPSSEPSISGDGRWLAYESGASNLVTGDANGAYDVFVTDRSTGVTALVSTATDGTQGNGHSLGPWMSADGRWIAYDSYASNLVGGDTNGAYDVYVSGNRLAE